jgi:DNA-cytosine methyltransferase
MNKLKLLDLFSGIGGFSLGLESTGYFQTIAFVEKDKFCRKVLQKNFNNIPIEEDIRNVRGSNYAADVITGGFPCQPFSVAGKRKGTDDDRYLWDETIRVVAECKPRWFIGENVEGLININNGMVLRQVQTDLEEQGFQVQCLVIPASGIGAWHQRKRIWIVAYSHNNGSYRSQRNETEQSCNKQEDRLSFRDDKDVPNSSSQRPFTRNNREMETKTRDKKETGDQSSLQTLSSCSNVSNTHNSRDRTSQNDINKDWEKDIKGREELTQFKSSGHSKDVSNSKSKGSFSTSESKPSSEERTRLDINKKKNWSEIWSYASRCSEQVGSGNVPNTSSERSQGCGIQHNLEGEQRSEEFAAKTSSETQQTWWETQSKFCGVPNGVSYELDKDRSSRIKALGNSIVPQIARQIGLSIMKGELTNNE